MKSVAAALAFVVLVSGCAANVHFRSSTPPPAPPSGVHGGASVGLHIHGTSLAALIVAAALLGAAAESFRLAQPAQRPAPLAADRAVNEQDCSRPIADAYANLRCK